MAGRAPGKKQAGAEEMFDPYIDLSGILLYVVTSDHKNLRAARDIATSDGTKEERLRRMIAWTREIYTGLYEKESLEQPERRYSQEEVVKQVITFATSVVLELGFFPDDFAHVRRLCEPEKGEHETHPLAWDIVEAYIRQRAWSSGLIPDYDKEALRDFYEM